MSQQDHPIHRFLRGDQYPQSNASSFKDRPPSKKLKMEFIYGINRKSCAGNYFHLNEEGNLVYPAAACAVVWNCNENSQKIFCHHTDDVTCIAKQYVS